MERKIGIYSFLGLIIGAIFGMSLGAATESVIWGVGLGALFGLFIGWFVAIAVVENQKKR
jgi:hypothetical protein